jgi:hypothetical protein
VGLYGSVKKAIKSVRLQKRVYDPEKMDPNDVKLPKHITELNNLQLKEIIKKELRTYKSLNYGKKNINQLDEFDYHSYQVAIALRLIQKNLDIFVPDDEFFPNFMYKFSNKEMKLKISRLIFKYLEEVEEYEKEKLKQDYRWTPLEMTHLLYYLSIYKNVTY